MSQNTHGIVSLLKSTTVGTNIDAIGQTTNDKYLWALLSQVCNETSYHVLTIRRTMTRTNNIDNISLIQVCTAPIV